MDLLSLPASDRLVHDVLSERRYLKNVTPDTLEWYQTAFKAYKRTATATTAPRKQTRRRVYLQAALVRPRPNGRGAATNPSLRPTGTARGPFQRWM
jgi:hypothetical protein